LRAAVASVSAVIVAILFIQAANGVQTSLLSARAAMEAFPAWAIGIVMACYYVGYSLAPVTSHGVIGRNGHVRTMALGAVVAAAAIAAHAFLVTPIVWGALRLVSGFALSSLYVSAESWIHARVANDKRGRVFSIYMVVQMVAMTLSQAILNLGDPRGPVLFLLATAIFFVGAWPPVIARHTAPHRAPPEPLHIPSLFAASPLGAIATVLSGVTWSIVFTFGPIYAQQSGLAWSQLTLFTALAMIGGAVVQFPMGWLSDAIGRRTTIALMSGAGVIVGLFGVWADGQGLTLKFAAALLTGAAIFPMYAVSAAHTNDNIAQDKRVAAAAGLILLFGLGSIFGPLLIGGVIGALGTQGYYIVLAAASALSLAAAASTR
jgi:MFS family permease